MRRFTALGVIALTATLGLCGVAPAADGVTVQLSLKDHAFTPAEPTVEAGKPITIEITNADPIPAEFESKQLRVEKLVVAGGKITVQVRPLTPGRYKFFDDQHQGTEGFLVVK
jgi:heme/copper-type cytochrome/quinol oxidase subunit 2